MKPVLSKGQLTTWKDDRGFGFIKPDDGSAEVFLHISVLKGASRRPKVGDTILYERVAEPGGKIRAAKASIPGVAPRPLPTSPTKQKPKNCRLFKTVAGLGFLTIIALLTMEFSPSRSPSPMASITKPGCTIKGNISINTGNPVYHLSGMEDYESTVIDPASGERWFCTESEAIANGWRKAPR
ncbi:cold shock domain-containing protein [Leptolyngbya sp. FACHB-261]|uniref:cold shock domain-containing protein n=1 Tax=Leptolyngbya sp. FACHB-261 TaxID=2692806 RepID=UPI0016879191|nr:cold shock domain-containing protein [Leptolyngbya sp. FACHB-261]MBD2101630.1 cold shock domain-containing protein [Leptolyngbya sp. FACHB-261]